MVTKKTVSKTKGGLTLKQRAFCELYASDREFFGNGVNSYIESYDIDVKKKGAYNVAKQLAYKLLTNVDILVHINELLELRGLNDSFVDKQLELLITQNADLKTKLGSIKEYNTLKKRVDQTKIEIILPMPIMAEHHKDVPINDSIQENNETKE